MMISPYTESEKFAILGGPGTGKTLLLFDLAKYYADHGKTVKVFLAATLGYNVCQELNNKYNFEVSSITTWSPVNKIDNLNRDFFVLCHD